MTTQAGVGPAATWKQSDEKRGGKQMNHAEDEWAESLNQIEEFNKTNASLYSSCVVL